MITTIALGYGQDSLDPLLVCQAHSVGARVIWLTGFSAQNLANSTMVSEYINNLLSLVKETGTDGVNIDIEDPIAQNSTERTLLSQFMKDLYTSFKSAFPHSQISFDVPWSPDCIDGRCYDFVALNKFTDFLFVMAYDERSQVFPPAPCIAWSGSGVGPDTDGLEAFMKLGIPSSRLVFGLPWYGHDYPCNNMSANGTECWIPYDNWRGVNCSDAVSAWRNYDNILAMVANGSSVVWDPVSSTPYFNYMLTSGGNHQVWFENPESLTIKSALAKTLHLRGVGMWNADAVNYSDPLNSYSLWNAFNAFLK